MKSRSEIGELGIHGFSLGCGVAINTAANNRRAIKTMALWSCINTFEEQLEELEEIDSAAVNKAMSEGKAEFDLGWRTVTLGKDFFESLKKYNLQDDFRKFKGNVLIIDGAEDTLVTSLETYSALAPERTTTYAIADAGHIYAVFSGNPKPADELIEKTVSWYIENLK
jgi:alpha/beta superfamily hydrolase